MDLEKAVMLLWEREKWDEISAEGDILSFCYFRFSAKDFRWGIRKLRDDVTF